MEPVEQLQIIPLELLCVSKVCLLSYLLTSAVHRLTNGCLMETEQTKFFKIPRV